MSESVPEVSYSAVPGSSVSSSAVSGSSLSYSANVDRALLGDLPWQPALEHLDLLAAPVAAGLQAVAQNHPELSAQALVTEIDPEFADTEPMTEHYGLDLAVSCNCVLVAGKREGEERVAACVVRATTRADVNHVVKKFLNVRKASFWPTELAVEASGMEYGGISPVGVPAAWNLLIDERVAAGTALIGSGLRRSKLVVPGALLAQLPGAHVLSNLAIE